MGNMNIYNARRHAILMSQPHLETSSGSLVTLSKAEPAPMKNCIVTFGPIQEGTGTPSPSNVRNISGRTGLSVHVSATESGGTEYPVTWQTAAGTVYGGTVDLVSGVLTVRKHMMTFVGNGNEHLGWSNGYASVANGWLSVKPYYGGQYSGDTYVTLSNMGVAASRSPGIVRGTVTVTWNGGITLYPDYPDTVTDLNSFNNWVADGHHIQVAYEMETPVTYQLDPITLRTLRGTTNIWSDAGTVSATYWTH